MTGSRHTHDHPPWTTDHETGVETDSCRRDAHGDLLAVLTDFAVRASSDFDAPAILAQLSTATAQLLGVAGVGIAYPDQQRLRYVSASDPRVAVVERRQDAVQEVPCVQAHHSGLVVIEEDLAAHSSRWPAVAQTALQQGLRAVASVPLRARNRSWGALNIYRASPGPFAPADLAMVQALAAVACSYLVIADDRARLLQTQQDLDGAVRRAQHAAQHDQLTGLPNRALLMDRLEHALAGDERGGSSTAVLFLDLDGFKEVNDRLGHQVGDLVLVQVASRLRSVLRQGDTLARLGGDEFVIVMEGLRSPDPSPLPAAPPAPDAPEPSQTSANAGDEGLDVTASVAASVAAGVAAGVAADVAADVAAGVAVEAVAGVPSIVVLERVRAVLAAPMQVSGHRVQVQASLGLATAAVGAHGAQEMLRVADQAMYEAKRDRPTRRRHQAPTSRAPREPR